MNAFQTSEGKENDVRITASRCWISSLLESEALWDHFYATVPEDVKEKLPLIANRSSGWLQPLYVHCREAYARYSRIRLMRAKLVFGNSTLPEVVALKIISYVYPFFLLVLPSI